MNDDILKLAAEGVGAQLFEMLQRGGQNVANVLGSPAVTDAGHAIGEGLGRVGGALEGMAKSYPMNSDLAKRLRSAILERRGAQGAELGQRYAPAALGTAAALGTGYLLKKLLFDRAQKKEERPEIYLDRYGYPDYY